jgi:hypothetical protein
VTRQPALISSDLDPESLNDYSDDSESDAGSDHDAYATMGRSALRTSSFALDDVKYGGKKADRRDIISEEESDVSDMDDGVADAIFGDQDDEEDDSEMDSNDDMEDSDGDGGNPAPDRFQAQLQKLASEDGYDRFRRRI